ncbi:MAG: hypothetical protein JNK67_32430 [Alphaproteobacteria bacterium]|nr:hypothetical protein [Alphaproteobacteria bacterium]
MARPIDPGDEPEDVIGHRRSSQEPDRRHVASGLQVSLQNHALSQDASIALSIGARCQ